MCVQISFSSDDITRRIKMPLWTLCVSPLSTFFKIIAGPFPYCRPAPGAGAGAEVGPLDPQEVVLQLSGGWARLLAS